MCGGFDTQYSVSFVFSVLVMKKTLFVCSQNELILAEVHKLLNHWLEDENRQEVGESK